MDWQYLFTSYEGRISRQPFWIGTLVIWAVHVVISGIAFGLFGEDGGNLIGGLAALALLYFSLAVATKRWHDRGKSGWWSLILIVPVVGLVWYLIECGILAGTPGPNRFGPDPLAS